MVKSGIGRGIVREEVDPDTSIIIIAITKAGIQNGSTPPPHQNLNRGHPRPLHPLLLPPNLPPNLHQANLDRNPATAKGIKRKARVRSTPANIQKRIRKARKRIRRRKKVRKKVPVAKGKTAPVKKKAKANQRIVVRARAKARAEVRAIVRAEARAKVAMIVKVQARVGKKIARTLMLTRMIKRAWIEHLITFSIIK